MFVQVVSFVTSVFSHLTSWFVIVLESAGMYSYFLVVFFLLLLTRFILAPLFGASIWAGASDTVRNIKERRRYHGSYERNSKGKFSR